MNLTFKARSADGTTYTISQSVADGLVVLKTAEGYTVDRLAKGEYEIVDTNTALASDDPDAP